jgi:hypothetical protein
MSASEQRYALEHLQQHLRAAGPHGLTPELHAALKRLGCADEHEALLKTLALLLDRREQAPAAGRSGSDIGYTSLY